MSRMQNRGKPPTSEDLDTIATKEYIESLTTDSISQGTVDGLISTGLSGYVSRSYVDAQDALNATEAYVDAGDDTRLKLADVSTSSGIAGLDSAGKVAVARVPAASTQRWPKPFYTPSSYNSVTKTATSTETTVYTIPVADPGFNYKLLVSGIAQGFTAVDGQGPIVRVRVGSTSGAIVAMGYGAPEQYIWGDDDFDRTGPNLGGGWEETYINSPGGHVETNGAGAVWVTGAPPGGVAPPYSSCRQGNFRKINTFNETLDDYQAVSFRTASDIQTGNTGFTLVGKSGRNRIYGRLSDDYSDYVVFELHYQDNSLLNISQAKLIYRAGGGSEVTVASASDFGNFGPDVTWRAQFGHYGTLDKRKFILTRNDVEIINWSDGSLATTIDGGTNGWGFGMGAGYFEILTIPSVEKPPATLHYIFLEDPVNPASGGVVQTPINIIPNAIETQTVLSGTKTLYVTVARSGGSDSVEVSNLLPGIHVVPIPA